MLFTKLILASTIIVLLHSNSVSSRECIYVQRGDDFYSYQINYVECKNVSSIQELVSDIKYDWRRLKIINDYYSIFTTAGQFCADDK